MTPVSGIHHITAIAGNLHANLHFYREFLGLRLVKKTVNFDNPQAYHLYFGNHTGTPGTLLTFFYWHRGAHPGRLGYGQVSAIHLSIPTGSLPFWIDRCAIYEINAQPALDAPALSLRDPDGIHIKLVEVPDDSRQPAQAPDVPAEYAIRGIHSAELPLTRPKESLPLLTEILGCKTLPPRPGIMERLSAGTDTVTILELQPGASIGPARIGAGTIHHIAFRVADAAAQLAIRNRLLSEGHSVSPVMDRSYFQSIYFTEPGGILFEIATDSPGFAIDEPVESLGEALKLPPSFESDRAKIVANLPPFP